MVRARHSKKARADTTRARAKAHPANPSQRQGMPVGLEPKWLRIYFFAAHPTKEEVTQTRIIRKGVAGPAARAGGRPTPKKELYRHGKAPCKRQGERHKGTSQLNPSHLHWPKDETHHWTMCTYARSFNSMSAKTSTMLFLAKSA